MATKAKTISTRAIAIAAVGAVAVGGVQVTAPTGSVLASGVTEASAQEAGTFDPSNIEYLGFFDPDGNEYTGLLTNAEDPKFGPDGATSASRVGSYVKLNITIPEGVKAGDGAFIKFNVDPKVNVPVIINRAEFDLEADGKVIGTVENTSYGAKITFNENVATVKNAEANLTLKMHPAPYLVWSSAEHQRRQDAGLPYAGLSDVLPVSMNVFPVVNGKVGTQATTTETPLSMQLFATYQDPDTNKKRFVVGAGEGAGTNDRVTILDGGVDTPINDPEIYPGASDTYDITVYPYVSPENGHPSWNFNTNFVLGEATNGATVTAKYRTDGGIDLHFENVPAGKQSSVKLSNLGRVSSTVPAKYTLRATQPDGKGINYGTRTGGVTGPSGADIDLTLLNHDTKMVGTIEGKNASDPNNPAPVAGGKRTVRLALTNNGNTSLVAPTLTLPNGKKQTLEDVDIAPGETATVPVEYDIPADAYALNWKLESPFQETPVTLTQYVTEGGPLSGDVTINPDGSVTIQTPDGPVTLAPKDAVDELEKDLKDANDKVADLQKQLDDEKKKSNANRDKIAELEKELEKAKTDLANTKDALKRAQDAAKAAQDSANNAQETANQALADLAKERARVDDLTKRADKAERDLKDARDRVAALEKENDAQQKQIDQARKDVKDLQDKTKKLRADLTEAEKRVSTLEAENKKQQDQIDALVKENKTQQSQIDALKKQNGEQQKQIDGLKAGLRDANKKITALETDLALTKIELAEVSGRLAEVEGRLNTGLGKCVGTIGGSLAALVPAVILASQFTGGTNIPQVDNSIAQFQRQLGMFNPQLAQVVDQNRGAIAAGLAGLGLLSLVLLPGTCGDASLGEAAVEPLSSARAERKAARENGDGGSSIKVGADVAAGEGAGSSEQNQ